MFFISIKRERERERERERVDTKVEGEKKPTSAIIV